jgi:hypothetical protein
MKRLLILTFTALALLAQGTIPPPNQYSYDDSFASSAGETLTLQLPAGANRQWVGAYLGISLTPGQSAKACFINNGTAATTTLDTGGPKQLFGAPISATKVYTASNSSGGVTAGCYTFTSNQPFNIANMFMTRGLATVQNISVSVTPLTGTISGDTFVRWIEQ